MREDNQMHSKSRSISPIKLKKVSDFSETRRSSNNSQLIVNTLREIKLKAQEPNDLKNDYTQPSNFKSKYIMLKKLNDINNKTFDDRG